MKVSRILMVVLSIFALAGLAWAEGNDPMKALSDEMKEYNVRAQEYMKTKASRLMELKGQLQRLTSQLEATNDNFARVGLQAKIKPVKKEWNALSLDLAKHNVEVMEKNIAFSQRRLNIAKQKLEALENNREE